MKESSKIILDTNLLEFYKLYKEKLKTYNPFNYKAFLMDKKIQILIADKDIEVDRLNSIFYNNDNPLKFFRDYNFKLNRTEMSEYKSFLLSIKDYSRPLIKMRKGRKPDKWIKKRAHIWIPITRVYYRSVFMLNKCRLYDTAINRIHRKKQAKALQAELQKEIDAKNNLIKIRKRKKKEPVNPKNKFLEFFFKWMQKCPRAYFITKDLSKDGKIHEDNIKEGDSVIVSVALRKAAWKNMITNLDLDEIIIPDYKKLKRRPVLINIKFLFFDLDSSTKDLMLDFYGKGYDDCTILVVLNKYYIHKFDRQEWLFKVTTAFFIKVFTQRKYLFRKNIYLNKYILMFEFWKAYKIDLWYSKYWDPEWYKVIGKINYDIKYYAKRTVIRNKVISAKVSWEEAEKLVEEDRLRYKAENIILKAQMKEKLKQLDHIDNVKWARILYQEHKKEGMTLGAAFIEILRRRIEEKKKTKAIIKYNRKIQREKELHAIRYFEPKKWHLRMFKPSY